jgi:hypothetical protein
MRGAHEIGGEGMQVCAVQGGDPQPHVSRLKKEEAVRIAQHKRARSGQLVQGLGILDGHSAALTCCCWPVALGRPS